MTGLLLGLAFLTSFGLGLTSVIVWCGLIGLFRLRQGMGTAAAALVILAALGGWVWGASAQAESAKELQTGAFEGVIRIEQGPYLTHSGLRFVASGKSTGEQSVCVYADAAPRPNVGDTVFVSGRMTSAEDLSEIGRAALAARDCSAQLSSDNVVVVSRGSGVLARVGHFRIRLSDFLMQAAPGDDGALLSGLVTGDDGALTSSARDAFLSSGTTHITAISGANFAVLTLLLGIVASGTMRRSLWFAIAAATAIWMYATMVGLQPSVLRAALLATAVLLGKWLGRIPDLLTLTLLLASVQLLIRPHDFDTLGFQLSIAATIALVVVFDGNERMSTRSRGATLVLCVLAAQLATMPVLVARLGTASASGLLANLLISPLASVTFPIALVGGMLGQVSPWLGDVVLTPAVLLSHAMIRVVTAIDSKLPGTIHLGEPVPGAVAVVALACWGAIFLLSGDLQRTSRHAWSLIRNW